MLDMMMALRCALVNRTELAVKKNNSVRAEGLQRNNLTIEAVGPFGIGFLAGDVENYISRNTN
jgi:hypothetical protein